MAKTRRRKNQILFRLNDQEKKIFLGRVKRSELTQQEYIRRAVLNKKINIFEGLSEVILQQKRIGNNLNQLAYNSNVGLPVDRAALEALQKEEKQVWQLLKQLQVTEA